MMQPGTAFDPNEVRACILAGGQSSRMGRDKADVLLGGRSLLKIAQDTVSELGIRNLVIAEDVVPKCGPLGGIITALEQTEAERIVLLPCDMPFVGTELIGDVISVARNTSHGACAWHDELACFPMCFNRAAESDIRAHYDSQQFSLQKLVKQLELTAVRSTVPEKELFNINTEEDLRLARILLPT